MQTIGGVYSSYLFVPEISVLFTLNIFFPSCSYYYSVCRSYMEALAFALNVLGDLF